MKKCKYCQSEIDKKAKICPNCRKKQSKFPAWLRIIIGVIILIIGISALGNDSSSSSNDNSKNEKFDYTIDKSYSDEYGLSYYIEGTVTNKKSKDYSYLQIEFVCYDKDGNNLGTALDNTNNLLGNQTWKYKASFFGSNGSEVDHCDYHEITGW